jgi:aryl-alcohol dehydrogenase-like predicted oxidoreductase
VPEDVRAELAPGYSISRVIKGGWQLAEGHGSARVAPDVTQVHADMAAFVAASITTFDCADIYTGVEETIGAFAAPFGSRIQVHTKYVPDLASLATVDGTSTRAIIDRSRQRLRRDALDLVQFHWWDYAVERFVDVALTLKALRAEGVIRHIGVTNFDTPRLRLLLDAGVPIVSHQVQYSLLDRRPAASMAALAQERGFRLLCYGSVLGGFLSQRWLGVPEPSEPLENRSLTKYKLIIDEAVGWDGFQHVLAIVSGIARKHNVSIGAIGIAWVLAQPQVAAAIVGARNARHLPDTLAALSVSLDADDLTALNPLSGRGVPGGVYEVERDREGPHGRIMKYNLNKA